MSDYTKSNIGSGYNTASAINGELGKIETAVNSKGDKSGFAMTGDLQMNSNDVLNVGSFDCDSFTLNGQTITSVDSLGAVTFPALASVTYTNTATGAVGRPLQERLEDVVSVKDFGACGGR